MADRAGYQRMEVSGRQVVECGGLRFEATFRAPAGATLRVSGAVHGRDTELLRFDDFIDGPHYHVPAAGTPIAFDRAAHGEPLAWFVSQLRDRLPQLLAEAGFADALSAVDVGAVADHAGDIEMAMEACVPDGYVRLPGVGLQRSSA